MFISDFENDNFSKFRRRGERSVELKRDRVTNENNVNFSKLLSESVNIKCVIRNSVSFEVVVMFFVF